MFEDSEIKGEFIVESENEEILPVCSGIISSESESNDEEESDDKVLVLCYKTEIQPSSKCSAKN
jgi:hypothetical protein